jgi:hypothetical protein
MSLPNNDALHPDIPSALKAKAQKLWLASNWNDAAVAKIAPHALVGGAYDRAVGQINLVGALLLGDISILDECKQSYVDLLKNQQVRHSDKGADPSYWENQLNAAMQIAQEAVDSEKRERA